MSPSRKKSAGSWRRWSARVTARSNALSLDRGVFTGKDPHRIALSLKRSAERSNRRKSQPYRSAMSMLTAQGASSIDRTTFERMLRSTQWTLQEFAIPDPLVHRLRLEAAYRDSAGWREAIRRLSAVGLLPADDALTRTLTSS